MPQEVKLYFDYKSPFAFLAAEPAFELSSRFSVKIRWIPFQLRIKGKGERSVYSEWKVQYSYQDARRWANRRGGFAIRGPRKIYDSTPSLIGAYFSQEFDFFKEYTRESFKRFFDHRLELDSGEEVSSLIRELGGNERDFERFLNDGEGERQFRAGMEEAHDDQIFGVPIFVFEGERFWGHDRIPLLEERLTEFGLGLKSEAR
ncbi:DsbA family protein [Myxococcota bacterium]|nr:DsbA family protein [Myxococcota bacterium]